MSEGNGNTTGNAHHMDWSEARNPEEGLALLARHIDRRLDEQNDVRTREHAEVVTEVDANAKKIAEDMLRHHDVVRVELREAIAVTTAALAREFRAAIGQLRTDLRADMAALTERQNATRLAVLRLHDRGTELENACRSADLSVERVERLVKYLEDRVADISAATVSTTAPTLPPPSDADG